MTKPPRNGKRMYYPNLGSNSFPLYRSRNKAALEAYLAKEFGPFDFLRSSSYQKFSDKNLQRSGYGWKAVEGTGGAVQSIQEVHFVGYPRNVFATLTVDGRTVAASLQKKIVAELSNRRYPDIFVHPVSSFGMPASFRECCADANHNVYDVFGDWGWRETPYHGILFLSRYPWDKFSGAYLCE